MIATGNNYAEALFMLSREENRLEVFSESLERVACAFNENPDYIRFLQSPSIPKAERISALEEAFGGRIDRHILSFLQLLCEHGKIADFDECHEEFERLKKWAENTATAKVLSAVELSELQKASLKAALEKRTGKTVVLETAVDSSLLGGLVVEIDGKLLDGSIKRNLSDIKEVISR